MAKGLSRIALIVATIAVVMLISSCSDVTESSQSSNKEKSVTSLVGEIYHGDGYFILDENGQTRITPALYRGASRLLF